MDFSKFDYGVLHEDQRARLGIGITDINGERWGYVRIREAMSSWAGRPFKQTHRPCIDKPRRSF